MKRLSLVIAVFFLAVIFVLPTSTLAATEPGVKPNSFFYFFDTAFERVSLFFTFNSEKKARKALEYADERLAEAEAVAKEKNTDAVKTAVAGYESSIALAAEKSKEVKDKGNAEGLLASIADSTSKHQEILSDILSKVPDEAKEAITKAMEASRKGQEEAAKQIAELKGEVEQLKKEVAELKQQDSQANQNNQSVEIEKLRQEVEELKKKTTQAVSNTKPTPASIEKTGISSPKQASPIENSQPVLLPPVQQSTQTPLPMPANPSIAPPTIEQLADVRRFCLSAGSRDVNMKSICDGPVFMQGYYSNIIFRTAVDDIIKKYFVILSDQERQRIAAEKAKIDCIMAPTPKDELGFDPAIQNYSRQLRCGTLTEADKTNYELSRIKSSADEMRYRLDSKISFHSFYLDPIKAPTFSTPQWQIRWEGSGGTVTDSSGSFYQFYCEDNTCRSY